MSAFGFETLKKGLGRQLLVTILLLVIIPALLICLVSYKIAEKELRLNAVDTLKTISGLQSSHLLRYMNRIELDLSVESERQANVKFLEALISAKQQTGLSSADFVKSYQWALIAEEQGADLKSFWEAYGYYDVFLLDNLGNILFTLAKGNDLGTNLFNGKYSYTRFARAAKKANDTGQAVFSDLEFYAPSNNAVAGFMVTSFLDENGDKIGLIAFQINNDQIDNILLDHGSEKSSVITFLIGTDLTMRTNPFAKTKGDALKTVIIAQRIEQWVTNFLEGGEKETEVEALIYPGIRGKEVLGVLTPIKIGNVSLIFTAEVETKSTFAAIHQLALFVSIMVVLTLLVVFIITIQVTRRIVQPILNLADAVTNVASGNLNQNVEVKTNNELGVLAKGFNTMVLSLRNNRNDSQQQNWLQEGVSQLNDVVRGEQHIAELSRSIISFVCQYIEAQIGAFYLVQREEIRLTGSYAFKVRKEFNNQFSIGEGIVGQAVLEQQSLVLLQVPKDYFDITSGLGNTTPKVLNIIPIVSNDSVVAVLEIGSMHALTTLHEQLIETLSILIAAAVNTTKSRDETQLLLERTQTQAEELQTREEELRESNNVLAEQSSKLEKSGAELEEKNNRLQSQQEELKASNEKLEVKAKELEASGAILEEKNHDLDLAKIELQQKADDLEVSSRYKSEFLANMSHELRTPLNSLLILAKLLADNKAENLTGKQIEYATTIHDSGTDLLNLINDILDLSKIEAGHMDVHLEIVRLADFSNDIERKFTPLADKKGITFDVINNYPSATIHSDGHKIGQVVKNLLSNAFKFTDKGGVTLTFSTVDPALKTGPTADALIQISIKDSGIGIPLEKQKSIFKAFQQADGTTSRHFGGTGLGLSISRELAKLLGGEITLQSEEGKGSTFSILISQDLNENEVKPETAKLSGLSLETPQIQPIRKSEKNNSSTASSAANQSGSTGNVASPTTPESVQSENEEVYDDRREISPGDRSLLIIEDDPRFSSILADVAREKGFKVLIAGDGETGLYFADFYKPSGIILDIGLPGIDGWQVMERLKNNLETRHIPVHFMSGHDKTVDAFMSGAIGYLTKPISMEVMEQTLNKIEDFIDQPVKKLLIVEDNKIQRESVMDLIGADDLQIDVAESGKEAIKKMSETHYNCIVLDLGLPDMNGAKLLETIRNDKDIEETPVVIYSGRELGRDEKTLLEKYANSVIIKNARSPEVLLDETALFLHRVEADMPEDRQQMIRMLHDNESVLTGRNILVVDDDMRNVFALTTMLRDTGMEVVTAKNGIDALEKLDNMENPDMVLMDIMMPEMDGYEAMEQIREQQKYKELPILALTAKAMKGDRAKCIDAGANDYLSKPIDTSKLLSMMRVWLYR